MKLQGEFEIAVDTKGRFLMPAVLRKQFPEGTGDKFVLNRGFEKCINIYPNETWDVKMEAVNALNDFDEEARDLKRQFNRGVTPVEIDNADRILLPKSLLTYSGITKDAILVAYKDRLEMWDMDIYNTYMDSKAATSSSLAKKLLVKPEVFN